MNPTSKTVKIPLTILLAIVQLAELVLPLAGAAIFHREFAGDNDDGTFAPTAARRWKALLILAIFLAIWAGQLYATIRALFRMWRERPGAISPSSGER